MIKYALACEQAHEFESWFPSSEAFETQRRRGLVTCPLCDSRKVEKQLMAPALGKAAKTPPQPRPEPASGPMLAPDERDRRMRAMLRALRAHVMENAEDVGRGFAEEARRMHYGEAEQRSIYGETTGEEARALIEEGVEILPLPQIPDDRN